MINVKRISVRNANQHHIILVKLVIKKMLALADSVKMNWNKHHLVWNKLLKMYAEVKIVLSWCSNHVIRCFHANIHVEVQQKKIIVWYVWNLSVLNLCRKINDQKIKKMITVQFVMQLLLLKNLQFLWIVAMFSTLLALKIKS